MKLSKFSSTFYILIIAEIFTSILVILYFNFPIKKTIPTSTSQIVIPTSTSLSFKTYKNDQYGFEFQYPNNILVSFDLEPINSANTAGDDSFQVKTILKSNITKYINSIIDQGNVNVKQESIIINNIKFTKLYYTDTRADVIEYLVEKNGDVIVINTSVYQILSTFKFTK